MVDVISKVVSNITVKEGPKTTQGTQYLSNSNYVGRSRQSQMAYSADGHSSQQWPVITVRTRVTSKITVSTSTTKLHVTFKCKMGDGCQTKQGQKYRALLSKKETPQILHQSRRDMVSGPDWIDENQKWINELYRSITNKNVPAEVKFDVMQRVMPTCPRVNMGCGRKRIPSLLVSGSQVTLICQSYSESATLPHIVTSSREKAEAHQLFQLTAANNGRIPMSMYAKLDPDLLQMMVAKVQVLVTH